MSGLIPGAKPYRVILAYGTYSVGDVVYPTGLLRDQLLRAGLIEPIQEPIAEEPAEAPVPEAAAVEPKENAGMPPPRRRGHGRPRKEAMNA